MAAPYSGLEVVPPEQAGLEHYSRNDAQSGYQQEHYQPVKTEEHYADTSAYNGASDPQRSDKICGLPRRTFWIVFIIAAVVIVAAAVGGGVGGALASKNNTTDKSATGNSPTPLGATSSSGSATNSATTGPITPSPTTATPTLTTTQVVGPSTTLLRDCPSSNNTLYGISLGDDTLNFRKICGMSYLNDISGGDVVNTRTTSLNDCINLCAAYNLQNATAIRAGTNSVCNAVCWRNTFVNDDFPGQCFGFTTTNSSSAFVIHNETICDSAAWIDQKFL